MNKSNSSAKFVPDDSIRLAVDVIFQLDTVIRFSSAFIHIFYFWLVFKIAELRKLSLLYVHHANVISFMFNLHYLVYYHYVHPDLGDERLNEIMCVVSEVFWAMLKLLRTYSIALIAVYRLIAVFKIGLYKKLNQSWLFVLMQHGQTVPGDGCLRTNELAHGHRFGHEIHDTESKRILQRAQISIAHI